MDVVADGNGIQHLNFLLEFLAAWEKRPSFLIPIAYEWCSALSEAAGRLGLGEPPVDLPLEPQPQPQPQPGDRYRPQDLARSGALSELAEGEFSHVGPNCDPIHLDGTPDHAHRHPQDPIPFRYVTLLSTILEIGFRIVGPGDDWPALHLRHTPHHDRMLETAFSSDDDEVVADAVSIWIASGDHPPPGSLARYLARRVERPTPFSPRLRQMSIHVIERTWHGELEMAGLETTRLLNRLDVSVDDMAKQDVWGQLLVDVIRTPAGLKDMSSHYWRLLGELPLPTNLVTPVPRDVEVTRSLETAEDWEKLEVWMVVVWLSLSGSAPKPVMEDVKRATLNLLLRRSSAPPRFEALCERGSLHPSHGVELRRVCDQARAEQLLSEPLHPSYVSVRPA